MMQQLPPNEPDIGLREILEDHKRANRQVKISVIGTKSAISPRCVIENIFSDCVRVKISGSYPSELGSTCIIPFQDIMCVVP